MSEMVQLPELGEGIIEAEILSILVAVGDQVAVGSAVAEVSTDKVTTEVYSEVAGEVSQISVTVGETIEIGSAIVTLGGNGGAATNGAAQAAAEPVVEDAVPAAAEPVSVPPPPQSPQTVQPSSNGGCDRRTISPIARALAEETGIDYSDVTGSDAEGRIVKRDIEQAIRARLANNVTPTAPPTATNGATPSRSAPPTAPPAPNKLTTTPPVGSADGGRPGTVVPLTPMRRSIASHMVASRQTSPHAMTFFDIDFSAVFSHRAANKQAFADRGLKLTFTPYIVIAISEALQAFPVINSQWGDDHIKLVPEINIGMAAALDDGLIVPVIKDVPSLNLVGVAKQVGELSQKARAGELTPAELSGGTFTLTNHGVSGGLFSTPIINQPQAGILGFGAIEKRVVPVGDQLDQVGIRPRSYASFAFDHRIFDGAVAEHFMSHVKNTLENWTE